MSHLLLWEIDFLNQFLLSLSLSSGPAPLVSLPVLKHTKHSVASGPLDLLDPCWEALFSGILMAYFLTSLRLLLKDHLPRENFSSLLTKIALYYSFYPLILLYNLIITQRIHCKNGQKNGEALYKRRYMDGKQAHEKVLSIFSH